MSVEGLASHFCFLVPVAQMERGVGYFHYQSQSSFQFVRIPLYWTKKTWQSHLCFLMQNIDRTIVIKKEEMLELVTTTSVDFSSLYQVAYGARSFQPSLDRDKRLNLNLGFRVPACLDEHSSHRLSSSQVYTIPLPLFQ